MPPLCAHPGTHLVDFGTVARRHNHVGTGFSQCHHRSLPNASASTRHQRTATINPETWRFHIASP